MEKLYLDPDGLGYVFSKVKIMDKMIGVTTEGTGEAYTATVEGITSLTAGATFMMIPHTVSTVVNPTLDVNGLGAKHIRRRVSNSTVTTVFASSENWLGEGKPVMVTYDGNFWIADITKPNANDIYGTVAIENGGTGAVNAADARSKLGAQAQHTTFTATLLADEWVDNQQTVAAPGVTADPDKTDVFPSAAPASHMAYSENGIFCSGQGDGTLTFTCDYVPDVDIIVQGAVFAKEVRQ